MNTDILKGLLHPRNDYRYDVVKDIALNHKEYLPLLGFTLLDREWEVCSVSITCLQEVKYWEVIEDKDIVDSITETIIYSLMQEHPIVRNKAACFIRVVPKDIWYHIVQSYYKENYWYQLILLKIGMELEFKNLNFNWNQIIEDIFKEQKHLTEEELIMFERGMEYLDMQDMFKPSFTYTCSYMIITPEGIEYL